MRLILIAIISFLMGAFCLKPSVVSVDIKKINAELIKELAKKNATEEQVKRVTLKFKKNLDKTITAYAKKHHVTILDTKNVVAGKHDVTEQIILKLSENMRAQK